MPASRRVGPAPQVPVSGSPGDPTHAIWDADCLPVGNYVTYHVLSLAIYVIRHVSWARRTGDQPAGAVTPDQRHREPGR